MTNEILQARLQALRDAAQAWGKAHKELLAGLDEVLGSDVPEGEAPPPEFGYDYEELVERCAFLEGFVDDAFVVLGA